MVTSWCEPIFYRKGKDPSIALTEVKSSSMLSKHVVHVQVEIATTYMVGKVNQDDKTGPPCQFCSGLRPRVFVNSSIQLSSLRKNRGEVMD